MNDPGYLRSVSLDRYDPERGWSLTGLDGETSVGDTNRLAALPARQDSRGVSARITVLGLRDRFLPVLTSPLRRREDLTAPPVSACAEHPLAGFTR